MLKEQYEVENRKEKTDIQIQFRDLHRQYEYLKKSIDAGIQSVVSSAHFISGEQVGELEAILAAYVGRRHCISVANGTDAITIALRAYGVGAGDAVFVPDFTFFSSGECPAILGATPVFVDVRSDTYNIDPDSLEKAVKQIIVRGELKPRAVVAVDLFGQPFDYSSVRSICDRYDLILLEDAAQGFGGSYILHREITMAGETFRTGEALKACKLGDCSTTSFFPAKPFGCYGDGGAIFTDDDRIADFCRSLAVHGKATENLDDPNAKYNNIRLGYNSRLDTLQAAILMAKFDTFCTFELDRVNMIADTYSKLLKEIPGVTIPTVEGCCCSSWAQYTVQLSPPSSEDAVEYRNCIQALLKDAGVPTNIYYSKPMHKQGAFSDTDSADADCPVTEKLCGCVLCLPIHPYLKDDEIDRVVNSLKRVL